MYRTISIVIILLLATISARASENGLQPGTTEFTQRVVEEAELESLSLTRLTLLRAGMFARHGATNFEAPWIADYFHAQPWYHAQATVTAEALSGMERRNLYLLAEYLGDDGEEIYPFYDRRNAIYKRYKSGQALTPADALEVDLSWQCQRRVELRQHYVVSDELLAMDDLRHLDRRRLAVARNAIFARRGYPFQDVRMASFYYRQQGYRANPAYTPTEMTGLDWENVSRIEAVEAEQGGPLQDYSFIDDGG